MERILTEEELIAYIKPYLKAQGFKKKNKRWTKDIGEFTLCFYIQGSSYSKEDYYIRPGVFINALPSASWMYGHIMTELKQTTPEQVMLDFENWYSNWIDKSLIKERLLAFIEWEERNPLEQRRTNLVDYTNDPVPSQEFFAVDKQTKQYILNNF